MPDGSSATYVGLSCNVHIITFLTDTGFNNRFTIELILGREGGGREGGRGEGE